MSIALFTDPAGGGSAVTPCAARSCSCSGRHRVRARLGSRVATTIDVCDKHRRMLEEAGELEDPVSHVSVSTPCIWPDCGQPDLRGGLCNKHLQRVGRVLGHMRTSEFTREQLDQAILRWRVEAGEVSEAPTDEVLEIAQHASGVQSQLDADEIGRLRAEVATLRERKLGDLSDALSLIRGLTWEELLTEGRRIAEELADTRKRLGTVARELKAEQDRAERPALRTYEDGVAEGQADAVVLIRAAIDNSKAEVVRCSPELAEVLAEVRGTLEEGARQAEEEAARADKAMRRAEEALAPLVERYRTTSIGAICGCVMLDLGHLAALPAALNVGSPSASDIPADCPLAELVRIVRVRSELLIEEREQRVAFARQLEEAERQARNSHEAVQMWRHVVCAALDVDPDHTGLGEVPVLIERFGKSAATVAALASWLHEPGVRDEVLAAGVYAVADGLVPPAHLVEAMHDRVALARLVLGTRLPAPTH